MTPWQSEEVAAPPRTTPGRRNRSAAPQVCYTGTALALGTPLVQRLGAQQCLVPALALGR
jgi:hypothetical protein